MAAVQVGALAPLGWDDRVAVLYAEIERSECRPARVVRVERSACIAATADGDVMASSVELPAVGDWVAVRQQADNATVVAVAPRWSQLSRLDPSGRAEQVLAANVDVVLITAPADRLSAARVEREIVLAWDSGARPVVLLTKSDLATKQLEDDLEARLVGVDLIPVSALTGRGTGAVAELLAPARTAVLLGPSGSGKSTLVNALVGDDLLATAAVRAEDHRGRHTTTSRQLVVIPTGGVLIDTPGLRSLGLTVSGESVDAAFEEIAMLSEGCRFDDCRHDAEPGCRVKEAVDRGELSGDRLASFRKLEREVARHALRNDPLLRQAERRRWAQVARDARGRARP
jgi:ribosome biogenesis GTPase / thiamine phosphate phosphatase